MALMKISISTIGCRANQADSEALARDLNDGVMEVVKSNASADLVVVNTCCVTREAERDSLKAARRALASRPGTRVILFGCAVRAIPGFAGNMGERVTILDDMEPADVAKRINRLAGAEPSVDRVGNKTKTASDRTRALLKIQSGCSHRCAYCVVPLARGAERSMAPREAIDEAVRLSEQGFKEIVLTGVQLGAWGSDLGGKPRLSDLVSQIARIIAPGRLRLSSIEPWSVDDDLIDALASNDRICRHLHIPLQSGDDRILAAMGRGYSAGQYLELVERVRNRIPDVALGADVILGFPGEDERAFDNTLKALSQMKPAYLHAFPFSPRLGTSAASMERRPPLFAAKERVREVRRFGDLSARRYRNSQIGKSREVLVEKRQGGSARGLTDNFIQVVLESPGLGAGALVVARLEEILQDGRMRAVPVNASSKVRSCGACTRPRRAGRTD